MPSREDDQRGGRARRQAGPIAGQEEGPAAGSGNADHAGVDCVRAPALHPRPAAERIRALPLGHDPFHTLLPEHLLQREVTTLPDWA
ncbi:hypothetical protein A6E92_00015 [Streptomyces sp. S8]|nr:hypothetical protein A6E92_00015 [Streptomyces sp. S8]